MGRSRLFVNKKVIGFAVEGDVYMKFIKKCRELGVTPSEIMREFVGAFVLAEKVEGRKMIVNVNVAMAVKAEANERKSTIELVRQYEIEEFKEKLKVWRASVMTTRNSIELYDIKKAIITFLRKLRNVDEPVLAEAKDVIELCNKRLNELRVRR